MILYKYSFFIFLSIFVHIDNACIADALVSNRAIDETHTNGDLLSENLKASNEGRITDGPDVRDLRKRKRNGKGKKVGKINKRKHIKNKNKGNKRKNKRLRSHKIVASKEKDTVHDYDNHDNEGFSSIAGENSMGNGAEDTKNIVEDDGATRADDGNIHDGGSPSTRYSDEEHGKDDASTTPSDSSSSSSTKVSGDDSKQDDSNYSRNSRNRKRRKRKSSLGEDNGTERKREEHSSTSSEPMDFKPNSKYWDPELLEPEVVINDWFAIMDGKKFHSLDASSSKSPFLPDEEYEYNINYVKNKALKSPELYNYYSSGARYGDNSDDDDEEEDYMIPTLLEVGYSKYVENILSSINNLRNSGGISGTQTHNDSHDPGSHGSERVNSENSRNDHSNSDDDSTNESGVDRRPQRSVRELREYFEGLSRSERGELNRRSRSEGSVLEKPDQQAVDKTLNNSGAGGDKEDETDGKNAEESANNDENTSTKEEDTKGSEDVKSSDDSSDSAHNTENGSKEEESPPKDKSESHSTSDNESEEDGEKGRKTENGETNDTEDSSASREDEPSNSQDKNISNTEEDASTSSKNDTKSSDPKEESSDTTETSTSLTSDDIPPPLPGDDAIDENKRKFLRSMLEGEDDVKTFTESKCQRELNALRKRYKALQQKVDSE